MTAARKLPDDLEALVEQLEALGFVRRKPRRKRTADVVVSELDMARAEQAARRMGLIVRKPKR